MTYFNLARSICQLPCQNSSKFKQNSIETRRAYRCGIAVQTSDFTAWAFVIATNRTGLLFLAAPSKATMFVLHAL